MNKTFTMIVASAALAGLAFAEIATDPAGYLEKSGTGSFVCNPFGTFNGTPRLADLDGSQLGDSDFIRIISLSGAATPYYWRNGKWSTKQDGSVDSSGDSLPRGASVQIVGNGKLVAAGPLVNANVPASLSKGNNLLGNASPVDKELGDLTVTNFDADRGDYVLINGTKYVYSNGNWYLRSAFLGGGTLTSQNEAVSIPAGQGFVIYRKPTTSATATLPGTY